MLIDLALVKAIIYYLYFSKISLKLLIACINIIKNMKRYIYFSKKQYINRKIVIYKLYKKRK